jgi:hypothetical protein
VFECIADQFIEQEPKRDGVFEGKRDVLHIQSGRSPALRGRRDHHFDTVSRAPGPWHKRVGPSLRERDGFHRL